MKKIYIAPKANVIKIRTHQLMAGSPLSIDGDSGSGRLQNENGDAGVVLSRRGSFWDDTE